jgi:hypothetical protein
MVTSNGRSRVCGAPRSRCTAHGTTHSPTSPQGEGRETRIRALRIGGHTPPIPRAGCAQAEMVVPLSGPGPRSPFGRRDKGWRALVECQASQSMGHPAGARRGDFGLSAPHPDSWPGGCRSAHRPGMTSATLFAAVRAGGALSGPATDGAQPRAGARLRVHPKRVARPRTLGRAHGVGGRVAPAGGLRAPRRPLARRTTWRRTPLHQTAATGQRPSRAGMRGVSHGV